MPNTHEITKPFDKWCQHLLYVESNSFECHKSEKPLSTEWLLQAAHLPTLMPSNWDGHSKVSAVLRICCNIRSSFNFNSWSKALHTSGCFLWEWDLDIFQVESIGLIRNAINSPLWLSVLCFWLHHWVSIVWIPLRDSALCQSLSLYESFPFFQALPHSPYEGTWPSWQLRCMQCPFKGDEIANSGSIELFIPMVFFWVWAMSILFFSGYSQWHPPSIMLAILCNE